ncbi:MAG: SRPBCC family protein [Bacteroidetes bacterium]|nr:SRPBCC family protein [Bacteroidota bacterium]MDA1121499.1 SRPBCC family protein [Bacteroidota bacterium]
MKKSNHKVALTINVSPEAAWQVIGSGEGVDQWLAPITACRVEGDKRYCNTADGEFSEDILKIDNANRAFHYAIPKQHMIPVGYITGKMQVSDASEGKAAIEWSWEFDVEENKEAEAKEILTAVGTMGIQGIETLINQSVEI